MPRVSSVQEVFDLMPAHFQPQQAGATNAVIQFDISGPGGGQWFATVSNGALNVSTGQTPSPNLTVSASDQNFLAIVNGELKPMGAFMQGKVRVKGDMSLLMKMQNLFTFN